MLSDMIRNENFECDEEMLELVATQAAKLERVARAAKEIVDVPIGFVIAFDELEAALAGLPEDALKD